MAVTGKIKRKFMAHFINTNKSGTPTYARLGKDLEEYKIEMNANTEKKSNILGETSYSRSQSSIWFCIS